MAKPATTELDEENRDDYTGDPEWILDLHSYCQVLSLDTTYANLEILYEIVQIAKKEGREEGQLMLQKDETYWCPRCNQRHSLYKSKIGQKHRPKEIWG